MKITGNLFAWSLVAALAAGPAAADGVKIGMITTCRAEAPALASIFAMDLNWRWNSRTTCWEGPRRN